MTTETFRDSSTDVKRPLVPNGAVSFMAEGGAMQPGARHVDRVCFVGGAGHSGSTLLGLMLGSHPSVFYAGEARKSKYLGDPTKPRRKRVCKLCGEACPVWGGLVAPNGSDLYEILAKRTGRPMIVDSSKGIAWLEPRTAELAARGVRLSFVFLQRDGRAVVSSRQRKYPEQSVRKHAEDWVAQISATRAFIAGFPGDVVEVRYERLATQPKEEMIRLADSLDLPFDPAMLNPWTYEHHPLAGNNGTQWLVARERDATQGVIELGERTRSYYAQHPRGIVLDLRWMQELTPGCLAEFERIAGEANRPFAWEHQR